MTERENFLERWSRKKAEARDETEAAQKPAAPEPPPQTDERSKSDARSKSEAHSTSASAPVSAQRADAPDTAAAPIKEFDLASLPSLDSITAATDIRPFLSAAVPQELTRAALRRAWAADPAIRDFVGLAENQWDFTDPAAVPGFGEMPLGADVKKMIAEIFGGRDCAPEQTRRPQTPHPQQAAIDCAASEPDDDAKPADAGPDSQSRNAADAAAISTGPAAAEIVQRDIGDAAQQRISESSPKQQPRRRQHGGALPRS